MDVKSTLINSSHINMDIYNLFDAVVNDCANCMSRGMVLLIGDLNSRTGIKKECDE